MTGIGAVSPIGEDAASFWESLLAGRGGPKPITLFDATPYRTRLAQTVRDGLRGVGDDPATSFALRAAGEALSCAGLDGETARGCGAAMATTAAGWTAGSRLFEAHRSGDDAQFDALLQRHGAPLKEAALHTLTARFGLEGPSALLSPACAAASSAIAWAAQRIRDGDAPVMLAGATDVLTEAVYAGFHAMRLLAPDACRPFSRDRRGLVLSEGAAFLVLEDATHAAARNATALVRLDGWMLTCDARHPTTPSGDGILRAMSLALQDAGLTPAELGQISAHGTGSPANDAAEADAIAALLGPHAPAVPVTAIKSTLGHTEGAAGAFAAVAAVLSLRDKALPPIEPKPQADPRLPPLRLVTGREGQQERGSVLVNASGFGGANASLVLREPSTRSTRAPQPTRHAPVVTSAIALTECDGTLQDTGEPPFWPGSRSLPLDRTCRLALAAAGHLLGPPAQAAEADPAAGVCLATTYGSQAHHERMWSALEEDRPSHVDPNDFALSTFNAPAAAIASAYGLGGPSLVFLGGTGGVAAIEDAARWIARGRAERMLAGACEELTPYFRRILAASDERDVSEAFTLLLLEDEGAARSHGARPLASLLGHSLRPSGTTWASERDFAESMRTALERAAMSPEDLGAVVLDPHANTQEAQQTAAGSLFPDHVALIDLAPRYGNCLAASAPLAVHTAAEAACSGEWPSGTVLCGDGSFTAQRPVLINAAGLMAGCASLVVTPHGGK